MIIYLNFVFQSYEVAYSSVLNHGHNSFQRTSFPWLNTNRFYLSLVGFYFQLPITHADAAWIRPKKEGNKLALSCNLKHYIVPSTRFHIHINHIKYSHIIFTWSSNIGHMSPVSGWLNACSSGASASAAASAGAWRFRVWKSGTGYPSHQKWRLENHIKSYPYHPWDWYMYLHLIDFYGKCR